jgi:hypothetical protein
MWVASAKAVKSAEIGTEMVGKWLDTADEQQQLIKEGKPTFLAT